MLMIRARDVVKEIHARSTILIPRYSNRVLHKTVYSDDGKTRLSECHLRLYVEGVPVNRKLSAGRRFPVIASGPFDHTDRIRFRFGSGEADLICRNFPTRLTLGDLRRAYQEELGFVTASQSPKDPDSWNDAIELSKKPRSTQSESDPRVAELDSAGRAGNPASGKPDDSPADNSERAI